MTYKKSLIGLMTFFFVVWFLVPMIFPETAGPIGLVTLPFRHIGIFVHEMGHGLFTLLSGGSFHWFQMELMKGGVAITSGGIRLFTLLGGLLGPALFGALLMRASTRVAKINWVMYVVEGFFLIGVIYMIKPLFMSGDSALLDDWHVGMLIATAIPGGAAIITWKMTTYSDHAQRIYLQVLGILMCYSAYSDTSYIFRFDQLGNGLYSDARVVASLIGPDVARVPFWLFAMTATVISVLNFGLMFWGIRGALSSKANKVSFRSNKSI